MNKYLSKIIVFIIIAMFILLGIVLFDNQKYGLFSLLVAILACIPFFISFERRKPDAKEIVIIGVLIAINVVSRIAFASTQHFKPVTAMVVICAFAFGSEAGFMIGSLTAVLSNMYFGQGPWTLFEMLAWGMIGFTCGLFKEKNISNNFMFLLIISIVTGVFYTLVVDIGTVISADSTFNFSKYFVILIKAIPITLIYIFANLLFLIFLAKPIGDKLERIKQKYGIFK